MSSRIIGNEEYAKLFESYLKYHNYKRFKNVRVKVTNEGIVIIESWSVKYRRLKAQLYSKQIKDIWINNTKNLNLFN